MSEQLRLRFWIETALAATSGAFLLLTLIWRTWIENVFGVDPDASSGTLEWTIVAALLAVTVACTLLARREWARRAVTA
jgi:hypothetical protein